MAPLTLDWWNDCSDVNLIPTLHALCDDKYVALSIPHAMKEFEKTSFTHVYGALEFITANMLSEFDYSFAASLITKDHVLLTRAVAAQPSPKQSVRALLKAIYHGGDFNTYVAIATLFHTVGSDILERATYLWRKLLETNPDEADVATKVICEFALVVCANFPDVEWSSGIDVVHHLAVAKNERGFTQGPSVLKLLLLFDFREMDEAVESDIVACCIDDVETCSELNLIVGFLRLRHYNITVFLEKWNGKQVVCDALRRAYKLGAHAPCVVEEMFLVMSSWMTTMKAFEPDGPLLLCAAELANETHFGFEPAAMCLVNLSSHAAYKGPEMLSVALRTVAYEENERIKSALNEKLYCAFASFLSEPPCKVLGLDAKQVALHLVDSATKGTHLSEARYGCIGVLLSEFMENEIKNLMQDAEPCSQAMKEYCCGLVVTHGLFEASVPLWLSEKKEFPSNVTCPITLEKIHCPIILPDSYTYELSAMLSWLLQCDGPLISPVTKEVMAPYYVYNRACTQLGADGKN